MSPLLVAQLEREAAEADGPDSIRAADAHALRCYRQQLIDAATLRRLHGLLAEERPPRRIP